MPSTMQPSQSFNISFWVLIVAGIWYPRSFDNTRLMHFVNLYRVLAMIFIPVGMLSIQFIYFFTVVGVDLDKTIDATALFTFVGHLFKAITVIINRQRINRLLDIIDKSNTLGPPRYYECPALGAVRPYGTSPCFFGIFSCSGEGVIIFFNFGPINEEDKDNIIQNMAVNINLLAKIYNSGAGITAIMWNLIPFLKPTLTLPFYYPDLPPNSPWFVGWYVYEATILIINGVAQTSVDHLFGGLMAYTATQLRLLQCKLESIGKREESDEIEIDDAEMEQKDYEKAVSCVEFHLKIIRSVGELTSIFGAAAFGQFVLAAPLLCLSAFIITTSSDLTEIVTRLLYFGCLSGQLFIYCYCGNMIKTQSIPLFITWWTAIHLKKKIINNRTTFKESRLKRLSETAD